MRSLPLSETLSLNHLPEGCAEDLEDFFADSVACLRRLHQTYGPLVAFSKGTQRSIFAFGPASNRYLFENPEVFHNLGFYPGPKNSPQRRLGNGIFNLNGARHKHHRRVLLPLFQKSMLDTYRSSLIELTDQALADWKPNQQIDLLVEIKKLTQRITMRLLFGCEEAHLAARIDTLFEEWLQLNHEVSFQSLLPVVPSEHSYPRMLESAREMEEMIGALVRQPRQALLEQNALSVLLRAREDGTIKDVDVIGEATHLFNAAYHTTAYALSWTLFLLAQHPEVLTQLYDEITAEAGPSSTLLQRCIKESLRILPPVVYFPRVNVEPFSFGPHPLPRLTLIIGSHYVTHHLPSLYREPERFWPDRWLTSNPVPYGYIPFGGGARMCVGAAFSQVVLECCLTQILRKFRLAVVPGARIDRKCSLTLGPRSLPMWVIPQDRQFSRTLLAGNIHEMVSMPSMTARSARSAAA